MCVIRWETLRGAIPNATLAALDGAGQFLDTTRFEANVLPSLVEGLLDLVGNVDDRRDGDDVVPAMDEAIKDLVEPKTVLGLAVLVQIANLAAVQDLALSSQRGQGAEVRVHRRIDETSVVVVALHVSRAIKPVDAQRLDALLGVVVDMDKFHDPAKIVGLAGRLAHEVHLICNTQLESMAQAAGRGWRNGASVSCSPSKSRLTIHRDDLAIVCLEAAVSEQGGRVFKSHHVGLAGAASGHDCGAGLAPALRPCLAWRSGTCVATICGVGSSILAPFCWGLRLRSAGLRRCSRG